LFPFAMQRYEKLDLTSKPICKKNAKKIYETPVVVALQLVRHIFFFQIIICFPLYNEKHGFFCRIYRLNRRIMEFFIDDENIEKQFQELFKEVLNLRNGEVHSEMKKYGLNYNKALGASVVNLRELAKRYESNHLLAQKLWGKGFRESRILASLLEKPDEASKQQVQRWIDESDTNELLEQICMNLLVALPSLDINMSSWMKEGNEKGQLCSTMTIGRLALVDKERESDIFENYISLLPKQLDHSYLIKQLPRALGKIARRNEALSKLVFEKVDELKLNDDKWLDIYEELQAEFPDIKKD